MRASATFSFVVAFLAAACAAPPPEPTPSLPPLDDKLARQTLEAFLTALHEGRYSDAVPLYGGPYDTMRDHNPSVPYDDLAALMRNACEINGAACLLPTTLAFQEMTPYAEFLFLVEFQNADRSLFIRGPCCGASPADQPPQSVFLYVVTISPEGTFLVMEMPPYVP
jgi:hypothetical protein